MVTIEVHTAEDVIRAYLEVLGFHSDVLDKAVRYLKKEIDFSGVRGDSIPILLNARIASVAQIVFPEKKTTISQVALIKDIFLTNGGVDLWGIEILKADAVSSDFVVWARRCRIDPMPEIMTAKMEKQKISLLHPAHMLKKILRKKKGISVYVSK